MLLNEQYRMHPEILKFPNQFFYHNQLHTPQTIINSRDSFLHPYRIFDLDYIQKDNRYEYLKYYKIRHNNTFI